MPMMRPASARAAWPGNSSRVPSHASLRPATGLSPYGSVGTLRPAGKGKLDELLFQAAAQLDEETLCSHLNQIYQHNPHLREKLGQHQTGAKRPKSAGHSGRSWAPETMQKLQERIVFLEKRCGVETPRGQRPKSPRVGGKPCPRVGGPHWHRRLRPKSAGPKSNRSGSPSGGGGEAASELTKDSETPAIQESKLAEAHLEEAHESEHKARERAVAEAHLQEAQESERKAREQPIADAHLQEAQESECKARERAKAEQALREEQLKCKSLELARQAAIVKLEAGKKERELLNASKEKYWKDREAEVLAKLKAREEEVERLNAQLLSYSSAEPQVSVSDPDWGSVEKQVRGVVAQVTGAAERDRKARVQEKRWSEEKTVLLEKIEVQKREFNEVNEKCAAMETLLCTEVADLEAQAQELSHETDLVVEELAGVRVELCDQKAAIAEGFAKKRAEYEMDLENLRADLQAQATQTAEVAAWLCERDSVLRNLDDLKHRATELEQKQWQLRDTAARLEDAGRTLDIEVNAEWDELTNGCYADHDRIRAEIERWEQQVFFLEERQRQLILTLADMEANFGSTSNSRPSSAGGSRPTSVPGTRPTSASMSRGAAVMRPSSAGIQHSPIPSPIPEAVGEGFVGLDAEIAAELAAWKRHASALEERQRALIANLNDAQEQLDLVDSEEERREAEREGLYMELDEMRQHVALLEQQRSEDSTGQAAPAENYES